MGGGRYAIGTLDTLLSSDGYDESEEEIFLRASVCRVRDVDLDEFKSTLVGSALSLSV